jgi:hypothetical protein
MMPLFTGKGPSLRKDYVYFNNGDLEGVRDERWKLRTVAPSGGGAVVPMLFDMVNDPYERFDVAVRYPDIVAAMQDRLATVARAIPR